MDNGISKFCSMGQQAWDPEELINVFNDILQPIEYP